MSTTQATSNTAAPKGLDVYMNNVHVGTLSDDQYQEMRQAIRKDPKNAVKQVLALGAAVFRFTFSSIGQLLRDIPVIVFWFAVLAAIFSPQSYTDVMRAIEIEGIPAAAKTMLRYATMLALLPLAVRLMISCAHWETGLHNVYAAALTDRIRKHFKLTSIGQLTIERQL